MQKELGRRKVLIVHEGMEEAVALMSTVLPAWDRVLARQCQFSPELLLR
jgi:hypothetical protein